MKESYTCISIDDDPLFLKTLELYVSDIPFLKLKGSFQDPIKGALAVAKEKPDLLFIDVEMPYLDGYETLSTLENCSKIIVISGHLDKKSPQKLPIDKFVSKGDLRDSEDLEKIAKEVLQLPG